VVATKYVPFQRLSEAVAGEHRVAETVRGSEFQAVGPEDLEGPLPPVSRSRHYLMLTVSETVRDAYTVSIEH